jgi:integrase
MEHFVRVIGNIDYQRVNLGHGELFRQNLLDHGYSRATVAKKLRHLKHLFQLAVDRKQLDENPIKSLKLPRSPKRKVEIFKLDECERLMKAAREYQADVSPILRWDMLITVGLTTAMRRGELLNTTWRDIDFEAMTIEVNSKQNTDETWEWQVKDTDNRTLPLTEEVISLLVMYQNSQPEGYPYVFVPPCRYDRIQQLRKQGKWTLCSSRQNLIHNFTRQFRLILKRASIQRLAQFHYLRRTALSNWLANGMSEYEVMVLAGHADFKTTHEFYLAVKDDLVDRARQVANRAVGQNLARAWRAPCFKTEKG